MQALREYNTKYAFDPEGGKKGGVESIDEAGAGAMSEKFERGRGGARIKSSWCFWACLIHIPLFFWKYIAGGLNRSHQL